MIIRPACPADLPALRALYGDAVRTAGPGGYTPAQVAAWAAFADDDAFAGFIQEVHTYVGQADPDADADAEGMPVLGFCGFGDDGHVASVDVQGCCQGQGIGCALLDYASGDQPRVLELTGRGLGGRSDAFDLHRLDWTAAADETGGIEFNLPMSGWLRLFRETGFRVLDFQELRAPAPGLHERFFVTADWAWRWPAEQVWRLRKVAGDDRAGRRR